MPLNPTSKRVRNPYATGATVTGDGGGAIA